MAYHSDFWVVVGTAAPVIGLAAVVTYAQARNAGMESTARREHDPEGNKRFLWAYWMSTIALTASIVALGLALAALKGESDFVDPAFGFDTVFGGMIALVIATIVVNRPRIPKRRSGRRTP